jgi:hypothetical protein
MCGMDWLGALDFELALANVQSDARGDWYRDPWDWCELQWLVSEHLAEHAVPRLNAHGVKRTAQLDVAKENFAIRPAVVLDPLDRLLYQSLVDRVSVRLIGDVAEWAYGWRLAPVQPRAGHWEPNDEQYAAFRDHLQRLANYDSAALTTDVVSFFASIPVDPLGEQILSRGNNRIAQRLVDMIVSWYRATGRGLPQRSAASAALAHLYLAPLDDVLRHYNAIPPGGAREIPEGRAVRWVDDIWLFGRSVRSLREAQIALQAALRDLGLDMNFAKTTVLEDEHMAKAVFELEHSAVDEGLNADDQDRAPLDELIDRVLANPELAERTTIRFMTTRMREHEVHDRIGEIADVADRLPHAADHLARLFRVSEHWRAMQEWYVAYLRRWQKRLPWSVAQFGTMFPSDKAVDAAVRDAYADILATPGTPLPLLTLAAQRLASWDAAEARVLIRETAASESHPLSRRSLGLAALHADEVKTMVRQILQQHEENALVLAMLEDVDYVKNAVPVSADYAGQHRGVS